MSAIDTFLSLKASRERLSRLAFQCTGVKTENLRVSGSGRDGLAQKDLDAADVALINQVCTNNNMDLSAGAFLKSFVMEHLDEMILDAAEKARGEAKQVLEIIEGTVAAEAQAGE